MSVHHLTEVFIWIEETERGLDQEEPRGRHGGLQLSTEGSRIGAQGASGTREAASTKPTGAGMGGWGGGAR